MEFLTFAKLHGIVIDKIPPVGVWRRYPTEDHMHKRNGAVKFMIDHAFIQNWATSTEVLVWKSDADVKIDRPRIQHMALEADRLIRQRQHDAVRKAAHILKECQTAFHPYLKAKGFPDEQGNVWKTDTGLILVVPMRLGANLVGCQMIDETGGKKFLFGQRTSNAEFVFDNKGPHILCEGYATALSIRMAMKALKRRYTLHVCFSAGNMEKIAATLSGGFVVADNDASTTGEKTAKKIGWPFYMPPTIGHDFNDFHQQVGLFKSSQELGKVVR